MNKNLINYSKFVLSCGILAGICFYSNKENTIFESDLEELVSSSIKLKNDSVRSVPKFFDYEKLLQTDYNNQNP